MEEAGSLHWQMSGRIQTWPHLETPLSKGYASCLMNQGGPEQRLTLAKFPSWQVTSTKHHQGDYKLFLKISLQILVGETRSFHSAAVAGTEKNLTVNSDL